MVVVTVGKREGEVSQGKETMSILSAIFAFLPLPLPSALSAYAAANAVTPVTKA